MASGGFARVQMLLFLPSEKLIDLLIEMFTTHNERILLDDTQRAGDRGNSPEGVFVVPEECSL